MENPWKLTKRMRETTNLGEVTILEDLVQRTLRRRATIPDRPTVELLHGHQLVHLVGFRCLSRHHDHINRYRLHHAIKCPLRRTHLADSQRLSKGKGNENESTVKAKTLLRSQAY